MKAFIISYSHLSGISVFDDLISKILRIINSHILPVFSVVSGRRVNPVFVMIEGRSS